MSFLGKTAASEVSLLTSAWEVYELFFGSPVSQQQGLLSGYTLFFLFSADIFVAAAF